MGASTTGIRLGKSKKIRKNLVADHLSHLEQQEKDPTDEIKEVFP